MKQMRSMMLEKIKSMYIDKIDYKEIALAVNRDKTTISRIINQHKSEWDI